MNTCPNIATLRTTIPTAAGELITVTAYNDDWSTSNLHLLEAVFLSQKRNRPQQTTVACLFALMRRGCGCAY